MSGSSCVWIQMNECFLFCFAVKWSAWLQMWYIIWKKRKLQQRSNKTEVKHVLLLLSSRHQTFYIKLRLIKQAQTHRDGDNLGRDLWIIKWSCHTERSLLWASWLMRNGRWQVAVHNPQMGSWASASNFNSQASGNLVRSLNQDSSASDMCPVVLKLLFGFLSCIGTEDNTKQLKLHHKMCIHVNLLCMKHLPVVQDKGTHHWQLNEEQCQWCGSYRRTYWTYW